MEKKDLKFYEAPELVPVELEAEGHLLTTSGGSDFVKPGLEGARETLDFEDEEE